MRFVPNPKFEQEIERQVEYRAGLIERAEVAKEEAKLIAPFRKGTYRDSISVLAVGPNVYLRATDWKAWMLEYGTHGPAPTRKTPAFATLRRAVLQSGLRLDEKKRVTKAMRHSAWAPLKGFTGTVIRSVPPA